MNRIDTEAHGGDTEAHREDRAAAPRPGAQGPREVRQVARRVLTGTESQAWSAARRLRLSGVVDPGRGGGSESWLNRIDTEAHGGDTEAHGED